MRGTRVMRTGPSDLYVKNGFTAVEDMAVQQLDLRPDVRDHIGYQLADLFLDRRPVHRRQHFIQAYDPKVSVDKGEPEGCLGDKHLKQSRSIRGFVLVESRGLLRNYDHTYPLRQGSKEATAVPLIGDALMEQYLLA